jgi:hypothetical protein
VKFLDLSNSDQKAIVDDDIWVRFCGYTWRLKKSGAGEYVVRTQSYWVYVGNTRRRKTKVLRLHRLVMNCPDNMEVHHKNGILDNRREQLEIVAPTGEHKIESGKKRWSKKRWSQGQ